MKRTAQILEICESIRERISNNPDFWGIVMREETYKAIKEAYSPKAEYPVTRQYARLFGLKIIVADEWMERMGIRHDETYLVDERLARVIIDYQMRIKEVNTWKKKSQN